MRAISDAGVRSASGGCHEGKTKHNLEGPPGKQSPPVHAESLEEMDQQQRQSMRERAPGVRPPATSRSKPREGPPPAALAAHSGG